MRVAEPLDLTGWRDLAACRGLDVELFFPDEMLPAQTRRHLELRAIAVCQSCPVRGSCLQYRVVTGQGFGVWGGFASSGGRSGRGR